MDDDDDEVFGNKVGDLLDFSASSNQTSNQTQATN